MNHHDIRLIEIGQKEGYAKAVRDIAAWLREQYVGRLQSPVFLADEMEAEFGGRDAG